jgi:hypothetical protein
VSSRGGSPSVRYPDPSVARGVQDQKRQRGSVDYNLVTNLARRASSCMTMYLGRNQSQIGNLDKVVKCASSSQGPPVLSDVV